MRPSPPPALLQRLGDIVETAMDAIITIDAQQRIVLFNAAASRMFGRRAQDTLGQPLELLVPDASRGAHREHVEQYAASDGVARPMGTVRALTGVRADGSQFPIEASISRIGDGDEVLMTVTVRDVTEVREAERTRQARAALDAANRAKNEFLSRMSHELRTPLNAIMGMTQLLDARLDERLTTNERRQFEVLKTSGEQLRSLIDHVLDLAQLEAGEVTAAPQDTDLCALLEAVATQHAALAASREVTLEGDCRAPGPFPIRADAARLQQAVGQLISNGIHYNRPGGWVRVSAHRGVGRVHVTVSDNGLGMNATQLASLYQPFNRLGREHSGVPGAGIGLALTRHLITLMGGTMTIESTPNVGTTVHISLPDAQRDPAGTLLYIEDNPVNALLVVEVLRQWHDVRVVVAETGARGLQQAEQLQPEVVLLDMHLPDMSGLEVLRRLRENERTRNLRVACLSANAVREDAEEALQAGACAYWTKPIDFRPFLDNLRTMLSRAAPPAG